MANAILQLTLVSWFIESQATKKGFASGAHHIVMNKLIKFNLNGLNLKFLIYGFLND